MAACASCGADQPAAAKFCTTISLIRANGWLVRWLQGDWDEVLEARDFQG